MPSLDGTSDSISSPLLKIVMLLLVFLHIMMVRETWSQVVQYLIGSGHGQRGWAHAAVAGGNVTLVLPHYLNLGV